MRALRGTKATFEADFVDQDGNAFVPADATTPTSVQIKDPDGQILQTGVGLPVGAGTYRFQWFVPEDATINTEEAPWSVDWFMVTLEGHNKSVNDTFSVVDRVEASDEDREWTLLARAGQQERVSIQRTSRPYEIGFDLLYADESMMMQRYGLEQDVTESKLDSAYLVSTNPDRKIGRSVVDGQYYYYVDTPALSVGEYLLFWKVRDELISAVDQYQRNIRVPEHNFWLMKFPLRILIDKLHKRIGLAQSYSDSDLYEYIRQGLGYVNMVHPYTQWTLSDLPTIGGNAMQTAVLLGAALWGLNAQSLLELEISFTHSGQKVTLEYNHDYGGVISKIADMFGQFVGDTKTQIFRMACGPARVGVRPKNYNYTNRVWRIGNYAGAAVGPFNVQGLISQIGL